MVVGHSSATIEEGKCLNRRESYSSEEAGGTMARPSGPQSYLWSPSEVGRRGGVEEGERMHVGGEEATRG